MNEEIRQKIWQLAEPLVRAEHLEIWGLDIIPGPSVKVRLFIDQPDPATPGLEKTSATIDQCESISRKLGLALEVEDFFKDHWVLEVSSPGLERKFFTLDQMRPYVGDVVEAALFEPLAGDDQRKVYRGKLLSVDSGSFTLDLCSIGEDGRVLEEYKPAVTIPFADTRNVRRIHVFAMPAKPGKRHAK